MGDALLSAMEESLEGLSVAFALLCLVGKKGNIQTLLTFAPESFQLTSGQSAFKQLLN